MMVKRIKQIGVFVVKFSFSAILLYLLISKAGADKMFISFQGMHSLSFIAALSCYVAIIFVSALRLQLLIPAELPLKSVFSISAIGYFFNLFLPSGISGDVIRAYYLKREMSTVNNGSPMDLVAPFLMERYVGLGSVLIIGLIVLPFGLYIFDKSGIMNPIAMIFVSLFIFFTAGMIISKIRLLKNNRFISKFYAYLDSFEDKRQWSAVFLYSVIIQIISILAIFIVSEGMGMNVSLFYFVVVIPLINIITILPIALGGIGLREGAFVFFLAYEKIQASAAISLSLVAFCASIAASLIGFYAYVRYKKIHTVANE